MPVYTKTPCHLLPAIFPSLLMYAFLLKLDMYLPLNQVFNLQHNHNRFQALESRVFLLLTPAITKEKQDSMAYKFIYIKCTKYNKIPWQVNITVLYLQRNRVEWRLVVLANGSQKYRNYPGLFIGYCYKSKKHNKTFNGLLI